MIIPEVLYSQYKSARSGVIPAFETVKKSLSGLEVYLTLTLYTVPDEYMLVLCNLGAEVIAGVDQTGSWIYVNMYPPKGIAVLMAGENYVVGARSNLFFWDGQLLIASGGIIELTVKFSDGTNSNEVIGYLQGMLVPELSV